MPQDDVQLQAAVVVEQEECADGYKNEPWEDSAGAMPAIGHIDLLTLSGVRGGRGARRRRRHSWCRWNGRRHGWRRGDMAFGRSHSGGETDQPNHDKDNRVGV